MVVDKQFIDDLANRLANVVPPGVKSLQDDLERNFRGLLQSGFAKLDLVTREEFDVQTRVLERTRQKLTALEQELQSLQQQVKVQPD
ncbi:MAG: accessory factor UbiK family protein [Gammaproteobacteria bacterium]